MSDSPPSEPRLEPAAGADPTVGASAFDDPRGIGDPHLDRSLVSGIAWTSAAKWGGQLVTWGATLVVARLLTAEDFGLVGMATLFLGLVTLLSEFGFGAAVVALRHLDDDQIAQINAAAIAFGVVSVLVSTGMARPLGVFFDAPKLPLVVLVMSSAFLIAALRIVPEALLRRDLHFKALALMSAAATIGAAVVTLVLAVLGFGYWALVLGGLGNPAILTVLVLTRRRHAFAMPRLSDIREALEFSAHVISSRLAWYAYSNADFLVVGRMLGQAPLGLYNIGWTVAAIPVSRISGMVAQVTPALFSAVQEEIPQLRRYFLLVSEGLAVATMPVAVGMALVAPDFVLLALGEKWRGAIGPMQVLALYASFRSLTPVLPHVLNVTGQSRRTMWYAALAAAVLTPGFVIAAPFGLVAVAATWLVLHPLASLPAFVRTFRTIDLGFGVYARVLWPAISSAAVMAAGVLLAGEFIPAERHAVRLLTLVPLGALLYVGTLATLHRSRLAVIKKAYALLRDR